MRRAASFGAACVLYAAASGPAQAEACLSRVRDPWAPLGDGGAEPVPVAAPAGPQPCTRSAERGRVASAAAATMAALILSGVLVVRADLRGARPW